MAANSQTVTVFKLNFETAQGALNKMLGCISELEDSDDTRIKLTGALRAMCEGVLANVPEIEK